MLSSRAIALALLCLTSLAACGKEDDKKAPAPERKDTEPPKRADLKATPPARDTRTPPDRPASKKQDVRAKSEDKLPTDDLYGDPLPPGVRMRLGTVRLRHIGSIWDVTISPDGRQAVTCGLSTNAVWDLETGKRLRSFSKCRRSALFSQDGSTLLTANGNHVAVLDYATGESKRSIDGKTTSIWYMAANQDRSRILLSGFRDSARLIDTATGRVLRELKPKGTIMRLELSPDGKLAAVRADTLQLYWTQSGRSVTVPGPKAPYVVELAFSPDSRQLATATGRSVHVWNVAGVKELFRLELQTLVGAIAYSPDGATLAVELGREIALIDLASKTVKQRIKRPAAGSGKLLFTPDGKRLLATTAQGNTMWLFDLASGTQLLDRPAHTDRIHALAFAKGGARVLSAAGDGTSRLWDARTGAELARWYPDRDHQVSMAWIAPTKDGRYVAARGSGALVLWDTEAGKPHKTLAMDPKYRMQYARAVAITPDGKTAAALTRSEAIVWNATAGAQRAA